MGLLRTLKVVWAGYPGGYKKYRRGWQDPYQAKPFQQPDDPRDRRSLIPPLGYREYWYPALPAKDVGWKKPEVLRLLGDDLVFFRDKNGEVKALKDACPHRGAYLSLGDCFYKGFITCPYHGATFDGDGNCVAFLTEGPDSKMVGNVKAWAYPTVIVKGMVFVWMGQGEPVDPKEDIPPEMFEEHNVARFSFSTFRCNWILCLENTFDAHNAFMVHRNAVRVLFGASRIGGRPRTPLGYRTKIINDKCVHYQPGGDKAPTERYYFDEDGNMPYQMYYPGVDGKWPLHRWRLLWTWFWEWKAKRAMARKKVVPGSEQDRAREWEWNGTRLPGMSRTGGANEEYRSTRWAVPIERDLTRLVYLNVARYPKAPGLWTHFSDWALWPLYNWSFNFNFRNQDYDAERTCQYDLPEHLTSTDSVVIAIRKLFTEHNRDRERSNDKVELPESLEEQMLKKSDLLVAEDLKTPFADKLKEGILQRT